MDHVESEIQRLIALLKKGQSPDGTWRYCFEVGIMADAYMIILLRSLMIDDEELIRKLAARIVQKQEQNGAWKLFYDEQDGNLSTTIDAYFALLFSGYRSKNDENMQAARQFIIKKGGLGEANTLTKVMLSITGQFLWPTHFVVPIEIMLLPQSAPLSFFDFVGYARVYTAPILILADRKFSVKTSRTPDITDLHADSARNANPDFFTSQQLRDSRAIWAAIKEFIQNLPHLPQQIHSLSLRTAERFMLDRIEPDGTLYSYFGSTFLMIFALLALGYSKQHPVIVQAVKGLQALAIDAEGQTIIQNSSSTVWDTGLLSNALQQAGIPQTNSMIEAAGRYLLTRQHTKYADWSLHNPDVQPGGWGFSDINTLNPDVDDSTAALRAITNLAKTNTAYDHAWRRGIKWVLSMQNDDGGWPAFEKNTDKQILKLIPVDGSDSASTDPSSPDLTGRTLQFLGDHARMRVGSRNIDRAVRWLLKHQSADGPWYGRWGVCYIYGTWAAVTGLAAVGVSPNHPAMQKAVRWLLTHQNADGGWGESCYSDINKRYTALGASTLSQTAWAVDALIAASPSRTDAIERGIQYLTESGSKQDWTTTYPTGVGLPSLFYIHYHSYRYIWPLLALGHYKQKYTGTDV